MLVVGIIKSLALTMAKAFMTYNFGDTSIVEMVEKRVLGTSWGKDIIGKHLQDDGFRDRDIRSGFICMEVWVDQE